MRPVDVDTLASAEWPTTVNTIAGQSRAERVGAQYYNLYHVMKLEIQFDHQGFVQAMATTASDTVPAIANPRFPPIALHVDAPLVVVPVPDTAAADRDEVDVPDMSEARMNGVAETSEEAGIEIAWRGADDFAAADGTL
jgi:hypothetical protein